MRGDESDPGPGPPVRSSSTRAVATVAPTVARRSTAVVVPVEVGPVVVLVELVVHPDQVLLQLEEVVVVQRVLELDREVSVVGVDVHVVAGVLVLAGAGVAVVVIVAGVAVIVAGVAVVVVAVPVGTMGVTVGTMGCGRRRVRGGGARVTSAIGPPAGGGPARGPRRARR